MNLKQAASILRKAEAAFKKRKTYENSAAVQKAKRVHRHLRIQLIGAVK